MKKRLLPIPLILLTPIVLLVVVSAAGLYRFSLSDEEVLAKFPSYSAQNDAIMQLLFSLTTPNPWTIKVPESGTFTFIKSNNQPRIYSGKYQDGVERGSVSIDTRYLLKIADNRYIHPLSVINQGSGVFYYLTLSHYDTARQRMVSENAQLLGDRIHVKGIVVDGDRVTVTIQERDAHQAMSEEPTKITTILFKITEQDSLERQ
ncbi:hypothetical protein [Vibrio salilacus]|uniref:hypothetical protein n=1 Tax=Vibrio salilacus TaxID=1323749 RepID=UPI000C2B4EFB|nr:hypothetical protein [Vibrio salilacus]